MRKYSTLLIAAATAVGCSLPMARAECLPPGLEQLAPEVPEVPAAPQAAAARGAAVVYLDASVSMLGFVQTHRDPQYADVILRLPEALEEVSAATTFNRFGKTIVPLQVEKLTEVLRPASYVCQPASRDVALQLGCDTRIDQVLQAIAASDDQTLSVMVTDLFLSRQDINGSAAGTIKQWLARVLHAGKSIGILGVSAAFDGVIYDLPPSQIVVAGEDDHPKKKRTGGVPTVPITSYNHMGGERPFFIVMAGTDDQLLRLQKFFETHLLSGFPEHNFHFTLFTRSPARPVARTTPLKVASGGEGLREEGGPPSGPDWLPMITIARDQAPIFARQPLRELQLPFTPPLAQFEVRPTLWRDAGGRCEVRWQEVGRSPAAIVTAQTDGSDLVLRFEREGLPALVPTRVYLMRLQVLATGIREPKPVTGWLHDWSFNEKQTEALLGSKPTFFPALNLGEFADNLEAIVNSSFEPVTVLDRVVAFRKGG